MNVNETELQAFYRSLRAQIAVWPRRAVPLWWLCRPAATLAAVGLGVAHVAAGGGWVTGAADIAGAIVIRPVRRVWVAAVLALIVWWLVPAAAVALAFRAVVSVIGIRLAGTSWHDGLGTLRRGRQRLTEVDSVDEEWEKFARSMEKGDFSGRDGGSLAVVIAAWCTGDARVQLQNTAEVVRGLMTGKWRFDAGPSFLMYGARLLVTLFLISVAPYVLGWGIAFVLVLLLGWSLPVTSAGITAPGWIMPTVLAAVPMNLLLLTLRTPAWERMLAKPRRATFPRLRRGPGVRVARQQWNAAVAAMASDQFHAAQVQFAELADDDEMTDWVRASAGAAAAEMALETGDFDSAAALADRALNWMPVASHSAQVLASAGRVLLVVGDTERAVDLLDLAMQDRRNRGNPLVVAAAYQAFALTPPGDSARAQTVRALPRAGWPLDVLVDAEVSVALLKTSWPAQRRADGLKDVTGAELIEYVRDRAARVRTEVADARRQLALGRLRIEHRGYRDAEAALRLAVQGLATDATAIEHAVSRILLGTVLSRLNPSAALDELVPGLRALEEHRGQLTSSRYRRVLINRYGDVYAEVFSALMRLQGHRPAAGMLAAELAESLRRSALARTLRMPSADVPEAQRAVQRRIAMLEADPRDSHVDELRDCYARLRAQLGEAFAAAYLPATVDYETLRSAVGSASVLTYHVNVDTESRFTGHVIWTPPDGHPNVCSFDIRDSARLELLGSAGPEAREAAMRARQTPAELERWHRLAVALIHPGLRRQLTAAAPQRLIIVPGGRLTALPWAALRIDERTPLVRAAIVQLTPTLDILDSDSRSVTCGGTTVAHFGIKNGVLEQQLQHDPLLRRTSSRKEFVSALDDHNLNGAYLATHGFDEGLSQFVQFADASTLSAAAALAMPWPAWVVFAACLVGRVSLNNGAEPLGLPVSCLLGGARAVIGGVVEVHDGSTDRLATDLARRLMGGQEPASALRDAQLAELSRRQTVPRPFTWAGLTCLSRSRPPELIS